MKATTFGRLNPIENCYVSIPGAGTIHLNNLPEVSDSKSAVYNNEAIIGRAVPLYTYSHSGDRTINIQFHFFTIDKKDSVINLRYIRMLESALYPRSGSPYLPPPICQIKIGRLLAEKPLCAAMQSCSVKYPTEVAWDESTYLPYRVDVDTTWLAVYTSSDLPFQHRIVISGR